MCQRNENGNGRGSVSELLRRIGGDKCTDENCDADHHRLASQILIQAPAWNERVRAAGEEKLRYALEQAGAVDIEFSEPRFELHEPDKDAELQFEPYWAWEIVATGARKQRAKDE